MSSYFQCLRGEMAAAKRFQPPTCGPLESPPQPVINFPQAKGRRFSVRYYSVHQWIEYSEAEDAVYCFSCRHSVQNPLFAKGKPFGNRTFIDKGFKKWKDTSTLFQQHENTSLLNSEIISEIEENRRHVKTLLKVVSFFWQQGLAFRGHKESETSENISNFLEMVETVCEEYPKLKERISLRYGHYSSPEYQNNLISVYSLRMLSKAGFYSVMTDETKDVSKVDQLAILIRYVDCEDWKIKERAIGLHHLKDCSAENIANAKFSLLSKKGLVLKYCVGQCYDGANAMSGWANRVQARVKHQAPQAIYFHCYAHHLNLVLVHSLSGIEETKGFISTLQSIYCFISNSSVRHENSKQPVMCLGRFIPTRWFCSAVSKILKNFEVILIVLDDDMKDRAESIGIRAQMEQQCFMFLLYGASTGHNIFPLPMAAGLWGAVAKRKGALTSRLADSVVFTSLGQMERNTRSIYFNILDTVMQEFDRRFSEEQGDIVEATNALKKTDDSFFDGQVLKPLGKIPKCSDDRLSSLMILAVEQEEVKKMPLDELLNDFARMKERKWKLARDFHAALCRVQIINQFRPGKYYGNAYSVPCACALTVVLVVCSGVPRLGLLSRVSHIAISCVCDGDESECIVVRWFLRSFLYLEYEEARPTQHQGM
ncbi:hypothetical protein PR048_000564 [Dryococelus australis]|uniref:DUF4371 domain-containing protein n=1 Tax=Dryococelus australis TaxID=614101 RepID=A0ABQ9IG79_9NEOP|nr:hypothetical protein PR048_000564 [Dryococelus australis]